MCMTIVGDGSFGDIKEAIAPDEKSHSYSAINIFGIEQGCYGGNYIQLDCSTSMTAPNESTNDTITIDVFHNGPDKYVRPSWSGKVGCDAVTDHTFHFIYPGDDSTDWSKLLYDEDLEVADPRAKGMSFVISTNGKDAFKIDELYLRTSDTGPDPVIAHWGKEGGKGYCLSTDPGDATRSWAGTVDGCHKEITFVVSGCDYDLDDDDGCQDVWHTKIAPGYQLSTPYGLKSYTTGSGTAWKNVNSVYACSAKAKKEGHLYFTWYSKGQYAERALCKTWNNPGIHWKQSTRDVEMRHYARTSKALKAFNNAQ